MKKLLFSASALTMIVMGVNFLFKIYLSYRFDKEDLGLFYTFMDVVLTGLMLLSGFKDSLVIAFDKENYQGVLFWYKRIIFSLMIVILILEMLYYRTLDFSYPIYYLLFLLLLNGYMLYLSYINASQKKYNIMLFENLVMAIGMVTGYAVLSLFISGIDRLVFAFAISYTARIVYLRLFAKLQLNTSKTGMAEIKAFIKNSILGSTIYFLSGFFITISGILFFYVYHDKSVLAEYQVVAKSVFFSLVAIFVFPINSFTFPQITKLIATDQTFEIRRIEKQFLIALSLFFVLLSISTFFTKEMIGLVFPQEYIDAYKMLNKMLLCLPFIAYTTFALNIIKGYERFDLAVVVRLGGSLVFFMTFYLMYKADFNPADTLVFSLDSAFLAMFLSSLFFRYRLLQ